MRQPHKYEMLMLMEQCTKDRQATQLYSFCLTEATKLFQDIRSFCPFHADREKEKYFSVLCHCSRYPEHPITLALDKLHGIIRPGCVRCASLSGFVCLFPMETHVLQK